MSVRWQLQEGEQGGATCRMRAAPCWRESGCRPVWVRWLLLEREQGGAPGRLKSAPGRGEGVRPPAGCVTYPCTLSNVQYYTEQVNIDILEGTEYQNSRC